MSHTVKPGFTGDFLTGPCLTFARYSVQKSYKNTRTQPLNAAVRRCSFGYAAARLASSISRRVPKPVAPLPT